MDRYVEWREIVIKMFAIVCEPLPEERILRKYFDKGWRPRRVLDSTIEEDCG